MKRYLLFVSWLICAICAAQQRALDSLEALIKNAPEDSEKVKLYVKTAHRYRFVNPDQTAAYGRKGLQLARRIGYPKGMFKSYEMIFHGMQYSSDFTEVMPLLSSWLAAADSLGNDYQRAQCYNAMGLTQSQLGDYAKSIDYYFKAIRIDEAAYDKESLAADYGNLALVYESIKNYPLALEYLNKAMQLDKETGDKKGYANAIGNLSNLYDEMGNPKKALEYALEFLKLDEGHRNKSMLAGMLSNIGSLYDELGEKDKAFEHYRKSLRMAEELGNDEVVLANLVNMGNWYLEKKQYATALTHFARALGLARQMGSKPHESECYRLMALAYRGQNNFSEAYEYLDKYNRLKDTLLNEENTRQINQMNAMYERDKQQLKIDALEKEKHLSEQVIGKQNTLRKVLIAVVMLIVSLAVVLLLAFVNKRKANQLLEARNDEIHRQKEIIEESNKSITDSINYASRIQAAILPAKEVKYKLFPDAFVLYQPRDAVSGDFYWFAEKDGKRIIAAVDCTGHGVPGAFMSMIGIDHLNHIVLQQGVTDPAAILDHLQQSIRSALKQDSDDTNGTRDGMDMALLCFDQDKVSYAGANRPLLLIRKGAAALETIEADHMSIGGLIPVIKPFTRHGLRLAAGDCLYIFTDGFVDQFGGPKGKKFRVKNLKDKLLQVCDKPMREQEEILLSTLNSWKGNLEQIDDVLVIGIRI